MFIFQAIRWCDFLNSNINKNKHRRTQGCELADIGLDCKSGKAQPGSLGEVVQLIFEYKVRIEGDILVSGRLPHQKEILGDHQPEDAMHMRGCGTDNSAARFSWSEFLDGARS